jgi:hypothetical protein
MFTTFTCDTTEPPPPPPPPPPAYHPTIELALVDSGLTDVILRVSIPDTVTNRVFSLRRNGITIRYVPSAEPVTIIADTNLRAGLALSYQAFRLEDEVIVDTTKIVTVRTLGVTGQDFTFDRSFHGEGFFSIFYDVAVLSDTLIYAVGEIPRDTTSEVWPWNIAKWNGQSWEYSTTRDSGYSYGELFSIHAFAPDDIWVASGTPEHWDGSRWTFWGSTRGYVGGFRILGLWGKDSRSMYAVGEYGNIRRFDGTGWWSIESGTTLHIYDIFGDTNPLTGETEIYAVAADRFQSSDHRILKIDGDQVTRVGDEGIPSSLDGVWFDAGLQYYVVGGGIYTRRDPRSSLAWQPLNGLTMWYSYSVRGSGANDILVCGGGGELLHFNGSRWRSYRDIMAISGNLYNCSIRGNTVAAVGYSSRDAFVAIGRR